MMSRDFTLSWIDQRLGMIIVISNNHTHHNFKKNCFLSSNTDTSLEDSWTIFFRSDLTYSNKRKHSGKHNRDTFATVLYKIQSAKPF